MAEAVDAHLPVLRAQAIQAAFAAEAVGGRANRAVGALAMDGGERFAHGAGNVGARGCAGCGIGPARQPALIKDADLTRGAGAAGIAAIDSVD